MAVDTMWDGTNFQMLSQTGNAASGTVTSIATNNGITGGTITTPPAMKTVTAGTGFTVLCGATDTSTYNYTIWN